MVRGGEARRVLGFDPGTARLGYGMILCRGQQWQALGYGCLTTEAHHPHAERLVTLAQGAERLLAQYKPHCVAVERLFFRRNVTTAFAVGQAWGVLSLLCARAALPVIEYTPSQVKAAVTGYGRADKQQVQHMVTRLLDLASVPQPDDTADALAVAICGGREGSVWN